METNDSPLFLFFYYDYLETENLEPRKSKFLISFNTYASADASTSVEI